MIQFNCIVIVCIQSNYSSFFCLETVPIRTVNRQCSSGLQAVADVAASIKAGFYDIGKVQDFSKCLVQVIPQFWL